MKHMLRIWGLLCALLLALPLTAVGEDLMQLYLSRSDSNDYAAYLAAHGYPAACETPALLYQNPEGVLLEEGESMTLSVELPQDTFGYPLFTYAMTGSNILDNGYTLLVDGEAPYAECTTLTLDSLWTQDGVFETDRYGNEVASMPVKSHEITSCRMTGKAGMYSQGMGLCLSAGSHEITIICREGPFRLYSMALEGEIPVAGAPQGSLSGKKLITLQAEQVPVRNNPNIRPLADYDMHLTPYSNSKKVINHIEDVSNKYPGDTLTYSFTVEEDGCYALALRLRQSELANFPAYRTVLVDGMIPGPAFENAEFSYALQFENQTVLDESGSPALIELKAGEHTLTLLTSVDPLRPSLQLLQTISDEIADLSLQITKITGGNTDFFRDFALADFDFHIAEDLARWQEELRQVRAELGKLAHSEGRVGALSSLDLAIQALETLAREPDNLPKKLPLFSQGSSSARGFLVSTVETLSTSPVGLDAIYLYTDASLLPRAPGFLAQTADTASRFIASFTDESYVADAGDESRLQVWVNRPRQYLEILQRMADTTFTPATGIEVDFSIMPDESKLILANASGSAPDVALGVSTTRVYDLAVRGALMDLRSCADFGPVGKRFPAGLLMPAVCDEGVYALPETFNFYVLFYRRDILDSIGVNVPNSYEDVLRMLPTLHRFGLNYNSFVANAVGYKSFAITTPFLYQNGAVLYRDGDLHVQMDSEEAIEALKIMTDSFVIYDMDFEVNSFYQSFRDGTLPIGTSNYGMYNLLMNAAPELADKWGVALYPGITDDSGEVQRWTSGAEQSCFIFGDTNMPDASWQFLTWWMSEEIQTEFAYTLQSTLGNEYMWNSANVNAFLNSPWPTEHKKVIAEQMNWIYETPRNPGSYMVERELSNAVNAVALEGKNLRAALDEAIKRIDRELERKLEEFGRLKNGELTQPFIVPDINTVKEWLE
ncbi:MAG: extracellular solute-binding protein [Clostridia bacterium]|nr:extracellular solute-binding protein [Clostridia bacterium]